ncbi:MAG: hypothetical protein K2K57_07365 [Oscillospiraceae bacterium]|nr:hypothetical protein [Oscillospiraceae bacterium]
MVVQHNIPGMNTKRVYNKNSSKLAKSLEKLSSGYAINRAGDNAAGLAVSEKMRSQIVGMKQAVRNCSDGISLIQTFEGALDQTVTIIKRMKTLAVQSANGTYCNEIDRSAIKIEFSQLCDEVNHIADTDFNGIVMLNDRHMSDAFTYLSDTGVIQTAPEKLEWSSYVNNTNFPDLKMTIRKLEPGIAGVTNYDKYIFESIAMLENAEISADLKKGFPEYYFSGSGTPANFSIRTEDNLGIITYHAPSGISADVAEVYLPEIPHNAFSTATGIWYGGGVGSGSILTPSECADCSTEAGRRKYYNWLISVPTTTVTVNDDIATYTNAAGNIYDMGSEKFVLPINSSPSTFASVTWNKDTVKPGDTITVGGGGFSSITSDRSISQYVKVFEGDEDNPPRYEWKSQTFSIGTVSAAAARDYWFAHNDSTLTFTYDTVGQKWSDNNPDSFNASLGLSGSSIAGAVADAKSKGLTVPATISFTVNIRKPGTFYGNGGYHWANGMTNWDFTLEEYDREHPEKGGIDYRVAEDGAVYTYVNTNFVSTAEEGHWEDAEGHYVNLESVGVYLPSVPEDGSRAPDTDILHSGMKIRVTNPINGATGTVSGKLHFWDSQTDAFRAGYDNLSYAEDLVIQAGARTKDLVAFTFDYSAGGIGDLEADLNCTTKGLRIDTLDVETRQSANLAIDRLDTALSKVSMIRSSFGAAQNRLEHKIDNLSNTLDNLTLAESRIRDTDMAQEIMEFTKDQILSQASEAMLAQASSLPQQVMSLMGES